LEELTLFMFFFSPFSTHDDLVTQALVWLQVVGFRAIQFGVARSCWALHKWIWDDLAYYSNTFKEKSSSRFWVNTIQVLHWCAV